VTAKKGVISRYW